MFSPYEYTWITPGKGLFQIGLFIASFLGLCYVVKLTYPDRVSYPREFEGGLERELGGAGAVRASKALLLLHLKHGLLMSLHRREWRVTRTRRSDREKHCILPHPTDMPKYSFLCLDDEIMWMVSLYCLPASKLISSPVALQDKSTS